MSNKILSETNHKMDLTAKERELSKSKNAT